MSTINVPSEELLQLAVDRFWETIPPVWNQVRGRIRATAAENYGISVEQFHILRHIRKGIGSVSELADAKQISRPAISQAVDVLVNRGLVTRKQKLHDRRFVQLELTSEGNELLNAVFQKNRAWMFERLASCSADELDGVLRALEVLKNVFDEPGR